MDRNVKVLTHHWVGHCLKPMLKDFNKSKYDTDKTIILGYIIYMTSYCCTYASPI